MLHAVGVSRRGCPRVRPLNEGPVRINRASVRIFSAVYSAYTRSLACPAGPMAFITEFLQHQIKQHMEDPDERRQKWEDHVRRLETNTKKRHVPAAAATSHLTACLADMPLESDSSAGSLTLPPCAGKRSGRSQQSRGGFGSQTKQTQSARHVCYGSVRTRIEQLLMLGWLQTQVL